MIYPVAMRLGDLQQGEQPSLLLLSEMETIETYIYCCPYSKESAQEKEYRHEETRSNAMHLGCEALEFESDM